MQIKIEQHALMTTDAYCDGSRLVRDCFDDERQVAAYLVAITLSFCLGEFCVGGRDLRRPSRDQFGRDDQRAVFRALALVVQVLLPVCPSLVLDSCQTVDEGLGLEERLDVRIWHRHSKRSCARRR